MIDAPVVGLMIGAGSLSGSGTIGGNLSLAGGSATFDVVLAGLTAGTDYGSLVVNGNVTLGGDLDLSFANGFATIVTSSEMFDVMTLGSDDVLAGSFADVANGGRIETDDGSGSFLVTYGGGAPSANEIVLSNFQATVPEPPLAGALTTIGIFALMARRQRESAP